MNNHCHGHPPTLVLTGEDDYGLKWGLYIGSLFRVQKAALEYDIIVNLAGDSLFIRHGHYIPPRFHSLSCYASSDSITQGWDRELLLNWPNYSIPDLPFKFWLDLYQEMKKVPKTLLFCMGGHGRTGAATALLLLASHAVIGADSSIEWLRKNYCSSAIESEEQEALVMEFAKWMEGK